MSEEKRAPVKYEVLERSLIGNEVFEAGATVSYDGLPAENLKPLCDEGRARYQEYLKSNEERIAKMQADNPSSAIGDPGVFAKAVREAIAQANAEAQAQQSELIAAAVAAALAQVFPNGVNKKAVDPAAKTADPAETPLA